MEIDKEYFVRIPNCNINLYDEIKIVCEKDEYYYQGFDLEHQLIFIDAVYKDLLINGKTIEFVSNHIFSKNYINIFLNNREFTYETIKKPIKIEKI